MNLFPNEINGSNMFQQIEKMMFYENRYDEASQILKKKLDADPKNKTALLYYALCDTSANIRLDRFLNLLTIYPNNYVASRLAFDLLQKLQSNEEKQILLDRWGKMKLINFVGQDLIREKLTQFIERSEMLKAPLPHILLVGPEGIGKNTLVTQISNELNVKVKTGQMSNIGEIAALMTSFHAGDILLYNDIDQIMKWQKDMLIKPLEDFSLEMIIGKGNAAQNLVLKLPRFTMIASTRDARQVDPKIRRNFIELQFDPYTLFEMIFLIRNTLATKEAIKINNQAAYLISNYSERNPGNASWLIKKIRDITHSASITAKEVEEVTGLLGIKNVMDNSNEVLSKIKFMSGIEFEEFITAIFRQQGFIAELTQTTGDHGIDIILRKGNEIVAVQCKQWNNPVGEPVIRDFYGAMMNLGATRGIVIISSTFSSNAYNFINGKPIQLIDCDGIADLMK